MFCLSCGLAELSPKSGDYLFKFPQTLGGSSVIIHNSNWEHCPSCNEDVLSIQLEQDIDKKRKEYCPDKFGEYPSVSAKLIQGFSIHGFRSGGGLRVVYLEKDGKKQAAYGEHPYIYNAFNHLEEDCEAGGLDYKEMYGKRHVPFWTGAYPLGGFDTWVYIGRSFDIFFKKDQYVFQSKYNADRKVPKAVAEAALKYETTEWEEDGFKFLTEPSRFPNGHLSYSTKCLTDNASYSDVWLIKKFVQYESETLEELLNLVEQKMLEMKEQENER